MKSHCRFILTRISLSSIDLFHFPFIILLIFLLLVAAVAVIFLVFSCPFEIWTILVVGGIQHTTNILFCEDTGINFIRIKIITFSTGLIIQVNSSLLTTSSSNSKYIVVLSSVQNKASSCLLLVLIPDPGILACPLHQAREVFYTIDQQNASILLVTHCVAILSRIDVHRYHQLIDVHRYHQLQ